MSLLRARDLWIVPPGAPDPVVRGVSLELDRGEWIAITGPNGGGKTSLALALGGLWPLRSGSIELEGKPLAAASRAEVAVILQEPGAQLLQPTVAEEVEFAARNLERPAGEIEADARCWSAALGIADDLGRDPHALSAGQQQLVLLAAALVARPRLLIADEAAAHLDAKARTRVLELLAREAARGLALVWVTQNDVEAARAGRSLSLGELRSADPARRPAAASGPAVLRVRVASWEGGAGPRVSVPEPLDFEIAGRGITALVGANGSGKSVLLSAVVGLEAVPQVRVEWLRGPTVPCNAALQYPENQIFEEVVADEVAFAASRRGIARAEALRRAAVCFERLGLSGESFFSRRAWSLSTGEKRLLEVVGALVAPAALLALDEPTAGLDVTRREELARLVAERAETTPILVASQDPEWVRRLGAREIHLGDPTAQVLPSPSKKTD